MEVAEDVDMTAGEEAHDEETDFDDMKKRLKEIKDEAAALREMQAKVEKEMDPAATSQANREEVDSRSVFVGNNMEIIFTVNQKQDIRLHLTQGGLLMYPRGCAASFSVLWNHKQDNYSDQQVWQSKGLAYVEFLEPEAVQEALLLNESELHGRQLKITAKRTNMPRMKQFRPRWPNPYMGFPRGMLGSPYFYSPYGYGKIPRFRVPMRYNPYG